jgi:hypothetical protein
MIQGCFTVLIAIQFIVNVLHDWLDIPGWTHGRQVRAAVGMHKMLIGTAINCIFPGLAVAFAVYFWNRPAPAGVANYWVIYCAITVLSAIGMWWIPYFRGTDEKTRRLYAEMYDGTIQVLPARGDNPRPNLMHLYFHALFMTTLAISILMRAHQA